MRYLMTFAYDGSKYSGYQKQVNKLTIQQTIETALSKINSNHYVSLHASGRTDSKVHALNQKAHFDLDKKIDENRLKKAINKLIPDDIYIKKIEVVDDNFHARFNVLKKEYIYKINIGEYNPLEVNYVLQYNKPLDILSMQEGIKAFLGTHNFRSFAKSDSNKESYVRTIYEADIKVLDNMVIIRFLGSGFLRYMVRNMVGLLIEIGASKKDAKSVYQVLKCEDRTKAGITAKPNGLYLNQVYYE